MRKIWALIFCWATIWAQEEPPISTSHQISLSSGPLWYTATTGKLPTRNSATGEITGYLSYTAYTTQPDDPNRPITFLFNGGPGCASILLHTCALGPKRAISPLEGQPFVPPYKMIENESTLLDQTDLVFIDPMSSGLSRPALNKAPDEFYHSEQDAICLSEFVRDYITEHGRWNSPKYLAGESYGTFRACLMARYLQSLYGIPLNGLILISCALDYQTLVYDCDNPFPYFLFLPTYAATAWHHGVRHQGETLEEVVAKARIFACEEAAPYYLQSYRYSPHEKTALFHKIADLTGLPFENVCEKDGKFTDSTYLKNLFPQKIIGQYDTTILRERPSFSFCYDPSFFSMEGAMIALFHEYLTQELKTPLTHPRYLSFSEEAFQQWQWPRSHYFGYPTALNALRDACFLNPTLKIYVGNGYYDAVTPFAATEHSLASLHLADSYKDNLQIDYYEGGHAYYLHPPALIKFKKDLVRFYNASTSPKP